MVVVMLCFPIATLLMQGLGFEQPHDLTVDPLNNAIYVTEIGPNRIWKFVSVDCEWKQVQYNVLETSLFPHFYHVHAEKLGRAWG